MSDTEPAGSLEDLNELLQTYGAITVCIQLRHYHLHNAFTQENQQSNPTRNIVG